MKNNIRTTLYLYFLVGSATLFVQDAHALAVEETLGVVEFSFYAPDWIWQNREINILCTLKNTSGVPVDVSVRLCLPKGKESHFAVPKENEKAAASGSSIDKEGTEGEIQREIRLDPEAEKRIAFANIRAKSRTETLSKVPRQEYLFLIRLSIDGQEKDVSYRVKTIRGASAGTRMWPFLAIIVVSCITFALVLSRFGEKGAWKKPSQSFAAPDEAEDWIKEEEQ